MTRVQAALFLAVASGCIEVEPPGEAVGTYDVTGTLLENSCGEQALPAVDPMVFQVELRADGEIGYWLVAPPARSGRLTEAGEFSFDLERSYLVEGAAPPEVGIVIDPEVAIDPERIDREQMPGACMLFVHESIDGSILLDAAADGDDSTASDLSGENEIAVRASAEPACAALLVDAGGPWHALPCRVRYDLAGDRTESP